MTGGLPQVLILIRIGEFQTERNIDLHLWANVGDRVLGEAVKSGMAEADRARIAGPKGPLP